MSGWIWGRQPDNDRNESSNDIRCLAGWTMRFLAPDPLFFASLVVFHWENGLESCSKICRTHF